MKYDFRNNIYKIVEGIPAGRVMTYSQIAAICGKPGAARTVGQVAHFGPTHLPWYRVVNAKGAMASGFVPGGEDEQQRLLMVEGVVVVRGRLDINVYLWWPVHPNNIIQGDSLDGGII